MFQLPYIQHVMFGTPFEELHSNKAIYQPGVPRMVCVRLSGCSITYFYFFQAVHCKCRFEDLPLTLVSNKKQLWE